VDISVIKTACAQIEADLAKDPSQILNESELQALLQIKLLQLFPERLPARLAAGTIRHGHHPELLVPRVFRELKLDAGRASTEADIVVLTDKPQVVVPKANGAPKGFRGPFAAIIETKIDTPLDKLISGLAGPSAIAKAHADLAKWSARKEAGDVELVISVVLTPQPERYRDQSDIITIRHDPAGFQDVSEPSLAAADQTRDLAIKATRAANLILHASHREYPLGLIREKDFESRILEDLRANCEWKSTLTTSNGRTIQISPVRAQWTGPWASLIGMRRRHDVVVLRPDGLGLHTEIELKTSHSDSHNWFRKSEVADEMAAIQTLIQKGALDYGTFALYRYGKPMWHSDAQQLAKRFPAVDLQYLCS
jgi:hypothetical protein